MKVWLSFKVFGLDAISEAIAQGFANAELAERLLREAGCWEIVTPAQMAIATFRYIPTHGDAALADEITHELVGRLLADGSAFASGTRLRGRPVIRMCTNDPRSTATDLQHTVDLLGRLAADLEKQLRAAPKGG